MASAATETRLEPLFEAELVHRHDADPVVAPAEGDGAMIGSGDGIVSGSDLRGGIRWTLFEHVGETLCAMNPFAVIETDDGATLNIEGRGWARRPQAGDSLWAVAATLSFSTDDDRYLWLNDTLGHWEGEFDSSGGRAHYRAYARRRPEEAA